MRQLNRYIATTVGAAIALVLTVILGLDVIAAMIDELGEMRGNYGFAQVAAFVLISIPGNLYEYLPFAALVGCLAGLGALANNSELVVMRAAGVSTRTIVWMVMRPTLVVLLLGIMVSEYVAPHTESIAKSQRATALRKTENVVSRGGLWHREGNAFMHFNVVQPNGILYGVTVYTFDDQRRLKRTLYAERAIYQQDYWLLEDLSESRLLGDRIETEKLASRPWKSTLSPDLLNILVLDPMDLSIQGLWYYSRYLDGQGLNSGTYRLAFWKKVLQPISTITLVLVAISFIFGPLREVTMGFRIFTGVLVGIVFRTAQDMLAPASLVYGFEPIYASLLPILVCGGLGIWLLKKAR